MTQPQLRIVRRLAWGGLLVAFAASPALAQTAGGLGAGNLGSFIQNIIDLLTNNVIRGLAVLAVIVTGVAWMFGHVDLRRACTVVLGIVVIFGAATIVSAITGGTAGA
jgi:type IV secretion system protein VirB2